ncbi:MAG: hypothetical protein AAGF12_17700, partial [Myxococcota bacterium]
MTQPFDRYAESSLAADMARLVPDGEINDFLSWRAEQVAKGRRPLDPDEFSAQLRPEARGAFSAWWELVRSGEFRDPSGFALLFGYNLSADGVALKLDGEDISEGAFPLGADMGGNFFVLLSDGAVVIWNHEEDTVEEHTRFPSLDAFAWTLLHVHAAGEEQLAFDEVLAVLGECEADTGPYWMLEELAEELGLEDRLPERIEATKETKHVVSDVHVVGDEVWCLCNVYRGATANGSVFWSKVEPFGPMSPRDSYTTR